MHERARERGRVGGVESRAGGDYEDAESQSKNPTT